MIKTVVGWIQQDHDIFDEYYYYYTSIYSVRTFSYDTEMKAPVSPAVTRWATLVRKSVMGYFEKVSFQTAFEGVNSE